MLASTFLGPGDELITVRIRKEAGPIRPRRLDMPVIIKTITTYLDVRSFLML